MRAPVSVGALVKLPSNVSGIAARATSYPVGFGGQECSSGNGRRQRSRHLNRASQK
jgi:hypothetical protein